MSCGSKYEDRKNRKEGNTGSMESLELTHSTRERQRDRERKNTKYSIHVCVFNAHVSYKSLQGITEVLSYSNAL